MKTRLKLICYTREMENERPKVGVGVLIKKGDTFLLLKRKNSHGDGFWGGTGGHLEHLESFANCAKRETREEAGIEIDNVRFLCVTNFQDHAPKHYVDIGLIADYISGEPRIMESHKCSELGWYALDDLPEPMFGVMKKYFEAYRTGQQYFDVQH